MLSEAEGRSESEERRKAQRFPCPCWGLGLDPEVREEGTFMV